MPSKKFARTTKAQCDLATLIQLTMSKRMASSTERFPARGGCLRTQTPSSVLVRAQQSVLVANAYFVPEGGGKRVATFGKILHWPTSLTSVTNFACNARMVLSKYAEVCKHKTLLSPSYVTFGA